LDKLKKLELGLLSFHREVLISTLRPIISYACRRV